MQAARRTRQRLSTQFFVTLGGVHYYESIREDFKEYFAPLETYCVSFESNHVNKLGHIRAFFTISRR